MPGHSWILRDRIWRNRGGLREGYGKDIDCRRYAKRFCGWFSWTKEAQSIVPAVKDKIENFEGDIIFTKDTHEEDYLNTQEGQNLPVVHCIRGTAGHEIIEELQPYTKRALAIFEKETFGSRKLAGFLKELYKEKKIESIELIGLCTDICVVSNALLIKAFLPEVPISVTAGCCAGVTPEKHKSALETMKSCQIEVR